MSKKTLFSRKHNSQKESFIIAYYEQVSLKIAVLFWKYFDFWSNEKSLSNYPESIFIAYFGDVEFCISRSKFFEYSCLNCVRIQPFNFFLLQRQLTFYYVVEECKNKRFGRNGFFHDQNWSRFSIQENHLACI